MVSLVDREYLCLCCFGVLIEVSVIASTVARSVHGEHWQSLPPFTCCSFWTLTGIDPTIASLNHTAVSVGIELRLTWEGSGACPAQDATNPSEMCNVP